MAGVNLADRLPHGAVGLEEVDVQVQDDVLVVRAVGAVGFVGTLADVESVEEESTGLELTDQSRTDSQSTQPIREIPCTLGLCVELDFDVIEPEGFVGGIGHKGEGDVPQK